jgi:beta-lactamase class A
MLRKKFLHLDFIGKIYLSVGIFSIIVLVFCIWLSNQRGFVQILPFSDAIMVYVDQNGHLYHGNLEIDGKEYHFNEDSGFMTRGFVTHKTNTYYYDQKGHKLYGFQTINDHTYYFDKNGKMAKDTYVAFSKDGQLHLDYYDKNGEKTKQEVDFDIEEIQSQVQKVLSKYDGDISVYFKDLRTEQSFYINPKNMYPCCMIKVPALIKIFQEIENGNIDHAAHATEIEQMITISSNTAYNNLAALLGGGNGIFGLYQINQMCIEQGLENTELHHGLFPGENFFTDGGANTSNPKDIGILFEKLYKKEIISDKACQDMISILKACEDRDEIQAGLDKGIEFAHKTGAADLLYHDGGIVYLPGRDYILVIFSNEVSRMYDMMQEVSKTILNYQKSLTGSKDIIYVQDA